MADISCTQEPVYCNQSHLTLKEDFNVDDEDGDIDIIGIKSEEEKESLGKKYNEKLNDLKKRLNTKGLPSTANEQDSIQDSQIFDENCAEDQRSQDSNKYSKEYINVGNNLAASYCSDNKNKTDQNGITDADIKQIQDHLQFEFSEAPCASEIGNLKSSDSVIDEESSLSSSCSSRKSSRRNSINSSENSKNDMDYEKQGFEQEMLGNTGQDNQMSDDDEEEFKKDDPYERFFFESDYLALQDNTHYHLLLQTLVALEAQRIQAIKDLDRLCEEEAKALDDPIGFVEKLQNNEELDLPTAQNVIKLPNIPWETYASSFGPMDSISASHNTRASANQLDKAQVPSSNLTTSSEKPLVFSREGEIIFSETGKNNVLENNSESSRLPTYNQPWTTEEQTRLEKLLQVYPQEEIEAKRWEKIAKALGNRTSKQVASRIQKYFIKLTKAGLPVPGRIPNVPKSGSRISRRYTHYQTLNFRNSTFFPSYRPRVYMDDNRGDDDESSVAFSDDVPYLSDDDGISNELRQTNEYKELVELKKMKRQKLRHADQQRETQVSHAGYMCDGCGVAPIVGPRWHCQDCPDENSVDFCSSCVEKGMPESRGHSTQHRLEAITRDTSFYVDGDYVGMSGSTTGYNYLDPNFLPAAS